MSYAQHRKIIDADSHVIELDDFLDRAATPEDKKLLPKMSDQKELPVIQAGLDRGRELLVKRKENPETMAKFEAALLTTPKADGTGWGHSTRKNALMFLIFLDLRCNGSCQPLLFTKWHMLIARIFSKRELDL